MDLRAETLLPHSGEGRLGVMAKGGQPRRWMTVSGFLQRYFFRYYVTNFDTSHGLLFLYYPVITAEYFCIDFGISLAVPCAALLPRLPCGRAASPAGMNIQY
ncbi:hypothetical protein KL86DPRO_11150 [uncultured delta proteobacterium]|uniref:Uncharacterized protein n=1 Tax=uncultured delta proteobacterium TaxID=34034 RepID=A0A212JCS7_9DELT|nr:hypothetical protein KL86DPRO_11150 [uncultured delta proteobacterium]